MIIKKRFTTAQFVAALMVHLIAAGIGVAVGCQKCNVDVDDLLETRPHVIDRTIGCDSEIITYRLVDVKNGNRAICGATITLHNKFEVVTDNFGKCRINARLFAQDNNAYAHIVDCRGNVIANHVKIFTVATATCKNIRLKIITA